MGKDHFEIEAVKEKRKIYINEDYTNFDIEEYSRFTPWEITWIIISSALIILCVINFIAFS